jgi:tetratricopeptide (TPR) repeat protein
MALALLLNRRYDESIASFETMLAALGEHRTNIERESQWCAYMGMALLGTGRVDDAIASARRGDALAVDRGQRYLEVVAKLALVTALLVDGSDAALAECDSLLNEARRASEQCGLLVRVAQARVLSALVALRRGEDADDELRAARDECLNFGDKVTAGRVSALID